MVDDLSAEREHSGPLSRSLRTGGVPLPSEARSFFEPRFGHDFGDVRVHEGTDVTALNDLLGARAFTVGNDIFVGAEGFRPETNSGRRLLAHELTHVVQQGNATATDSLTVEPSGGAAEREASQAVGRLERGVEPTVGIRRATSAIARQTEDPSSETPQEEPGFWGTVLNVLKTIGGGLMGEFNEDPSFAMIGIDTAVSLVPVLDQISDVRDIVAHLYYLIVRKQYNRFMRWLGLAFTLIGLIPEVGSAIKGASKFVIKGVSEVIGRIGEFLRPLQRLFPDLVDFRRLREFVASNWNKWVAKGKGAFQRMLDRVTGVVEAIPWLLSRLSIVRTIREGLDRVRASASGKLDEAFEWVRQKWEDILDRLTRREREAATEAAESTGGRTAQAAGETAETTGGATARAESRATGETPQTTSRKAREYPAASAEAFGIVSGHDAMDSPVHVVVAHLMTLKRRFRWIENFVARRRGAGRYDFEMHASENTFYRGYTPDEELPEGMHAEVSAEEAVSGRQLREPREARYIAEAGTRIEPGEVARWAQHLGPSWQVMRRADWPPWMRRLFPGRSGPDMIAVNTSQKRIIVGDIAPSPRSRVDVRGGVPGEGPPARLRRRSEAEMTRAGDEGTRMHIEKTIEDAEKLARNLRDEVSDFKVFAQEWYWEFGEGMSRLIQVRP